MNLITGATGLIGAHVALALLEQGKPVTAIRRAGSDPSKTQHLFSYYTDRHQQLFDQVKWIEADILDIYSLLEAFEGVDTVYHCAGFVSFNSKDRIQLQKINSEGTSNVVNACLEKNIPHLVHVSSIATLQNPDIKTNINETVYWKSSPKAHDYAISKYNGEREVWRGIEEGLSATIVNPGFVIGPGFWEQGSGRLFSQLYKGMPFYTRGATSYVDARDVAKIMIRLADEKISKQRFVVTEGNYPFRQIFNWAAEGFGKKKPSIEAGPFLLSLAKMTDALRSAITGAVRVVTKETIQAALDTNTYDNSLIKSALNYEFIPIKESIAFSCRCLLKDKKEGTE